MTDTISQARRTARGGRLAGKAAIVTGAARGIGHEDGAVCPGPHDRPVPGEANRAHDATHRGALGLEAQDALLHAAAHVPEPNRAVSAPLCQNVSVGRESKESGLVVLEDSPDLLPAR